MIYLCDGCGEPIEARAGEEGHVLVTMRGPLGYSTAHAHPGVCEDRAVANASEQPARRVEPRQAKEAKV